MIKSGDSESGTPVNSIGMVARDFIAVLMEGSSQSFVRNFFFFFLFCSFMKVLCVLE